MKQKVIFVYQTEHKLLGTYGPGGGNQPPEFMSTHPSHGTRIERLQQFMPKALAEYGKAQKDKFFLRPSGGVLA